VRLRESGRRGLCGLILTVLGTGVAVAQQPEVSAAAFAANAVMGQWAGVWSVQARGCGDARRRYQVIGEFITEQDGSLRASIRSAEDPPSGIDFAKQTLAGRINPDLTLTLTTAAVADCGPRDRREHMLEYAGKLALRREKWVLQMRGTAIPCSAANCTTTRMFDLTKQ
jgi:hypothetical protein